MAFNSSISSSPISLERSTPPASAKLKDATADGLRTIASMAGIENVFRTHRFSGTDLDKSLAALWLKSRFGSDVDPKRILLTNGAQNAMALAISSLAQPGDTVLVECLSYHAFRKQAHLQGVRIEAFSMDGEGAEPESFEEACQRFGPKAVFLMPTVHNPTTIVMPLQRREDIVRIARQYGVAIIEDDVYGLLPLDVPRPFGAMAPDITWHVTSFAKCVGAGVRVGYLVAPSGAGAQETVKQYYGVSSWFPGSVSVELVNLWLENGIMADLVTGVRDEAIARQKIASNALGSVPYRTLPDALFLWLKLDGIIDQDDLVQQCASRNVLIRPGRLFAMEQKNQPNCVRIVVGSPDTREELRTAMSVIGDVVNARIA